MKKYVYLLSLLVFIFNIYTFTSCVSAKKYQALEAEHQKITIEEKGAKNQLEIEKAIIDVKEKEIIALKAENNKLSEEVMNRATAGTQDIYTLQKKQKKLEDSLKIQKKYFEEEESRWQNTNDSLEYTIEENKKEAGLKLYQVETAKEQLADELKKITIEKEEANLALLKAIEAQKNAMMAQKVSEAEKDSLMTELTKLLREKKSLRESPEVEESSLSETERKELGKDLAHYFLSLEADKARVFNEKGHYVIEIDENFLFGVNGRISTNATNVLNEVINIIEKYKKTNLVVETTGTGTEDRPQKAELVRKFLADGDLNASSSPKNFTPIAFDTSKENVRKTKIYIK